MSPVTHFLIGWLIANLTKDEHRRERALIAVAGIAPDVDAIGIIAELATKASAQPLLWYSEYHHRLHTGAFCLGYTLLATALARRRTVALPLLVLLSMHLHLLGDIVGARGPDGHQWPLPYLAPFSEAWSLAWTGQWRLDSWQNVSVTVGALSVTFFLAWRRGFSPLEMISARADRAFVNTLRARIPIEQGGAEEGAAESGPK